jgi:hypothetical protein
MAPVRDSGWFNKGHADDPTSISPIAELFYLVVFRARGLPPQLLTQMQF